MRGRKFLRQDTVRHVRLGKNRPKLQKWRRPRGMHSKIRKKRFGYPLFPMTGFKKPSHVAGKVAGKEPMLIKNAADLENAKAHHMVIFSRQLGAKKKIELLKIAHDRKLHVFSRKKGVSA